MTSQTEQQIVQIHMLPYISRKKSQPENEIGSVNRIEREKYFV